MPPLFSLTIFMEPSSVPEPSLWPKVVNLHGEKAVGVGGTAVKLGMDLDLPALGPWHQAGQVLDVQVGLAALVTVRRVLVLDAHFGSDEGNGELLEARSVD